MRKMRLIRCKQGKTLDYVADCVQLTPRYIRSFETGKFNLKMEHKQRIADLLGITVKELSMQISEEDRKKYFNSNGTFKGFKAIKKEKEEPKIKANITKICHNQACPLNKKCYCDNDVVKEGRGSCTGQNFIKPKPILWNNNIAYGKVVEGR